MQSRWFWNTWSPEYRVIWYGVSTLFVGALLFLWFSYFIDTDAVLHWEKFQDQETIETVSHSFQVGGFEFSVPIESYITFEYFNGSSLVPNTKASYLFLVMLVLASMVLLTVITTFERFWFFIGMGLFILFMVSLRLEVLHLFSLTGKWVTISTIILFVTLSFYFNSINRTASFTKRLSSFLVLASLLGVLIYFFSGVPYPFLHLAVTGYIPGLILSIIFIIMVAHEILASFIYLTSQGATSTKSLRHFSIISVIYMANLFLAYFHEAGIIQWNFLYLNLYLLLSASAILAIWGYRQREPLYQHITSFTPFGAYFLVGLGIITFSTIGLLLSSANDPALKVIRDLIIFSHLGFGIIFLMYIFSNFILMLAENMNVYKVLYIPNRMPYITYRIAGFIAMLAFVFYSNWREYVYHSTSGFYNHLGDLYQLMDKQVFAEAYYQRGRSYGFQNHRSNYVIADLEARKNNFEQAHYHYEMANAKRPTEFSGVNNGNLYLFEEKIFNVIFSYKEALQQFPSSGVIQNNLGYAYTKIHLLDSALLLLQEARQHDHTKESAEINFTAFVAQEYLTVKADSMAKLFSTSSPGIIGNALVIATTQKQAFDSPVNPLEFRELNLYQATLLNNYLVNKLKEVDTTFLKEAYRMASDSINAPFSEALKSTLAQAYYHQGNVTKAFQILGELAYLSQAMQGKYNYVMGLWALEQGNPKLAAQCFEYAVEYSNKEANLYSAIALAEANQLEAAQLAVDTLLQSSNDNEKEIGQQLKKVLTISLTEALQQPDLEKYQYCRYRLRTGDTLTFNKIASTFNDNNYKAEALLDMSQKQFNAGNTLAAIQYYNKLAGIPLTNEKLFEKIQHFELELLASRGELRQLATKINEGITFSPSRQLEKMLYTAMLSEASGDTTAATLNYTVLAHYNPFYEEGIIAAARYFKVHSSDPMKAYNILTDAIHVNSGSVRLLTAYVAEAVRMGFDEYAASAAQQLEALQQSQ
jgi:hypothetical protein